MITSVIVRSCGLAHRVLLGTINEVYLMSGGRSRSGQSSAFVKYYDTGNGRVGDGVVFSYLV